MNYYTCRPNKELSLLSLSFLKGPWGSLGVLWKHMGLVQGQSMGIETGIEFFSIEI